MNETNLAIQSETPKQRAYKIVQKYNGLVRFLPKNSPASTALSSIVFADKSVLLGTIPNNPNNEINL
jgi:hypothetical protein